MASSKQILAKSAAISSLAVLGSRILGLVREQVFAGLFGASREYDAFLTAFRIPNLLRDLLAEGALSTAFVTVFVAELNGRGKVKAFAVANATVTALSLLLGLIVAIGIWFAPALVGIMALGFDADKAALTAMLTRQMFPYIFFAALSAVCMGMLNAQGRYGLPQSASTFFNITSISVGLLSAWLLAPEYMRALVHHQPLPAGAGRQAMQGMAIGTLAGGLVQFLVQVPSLYRLGWRFVPSFDFFDPSFVRILRLMGPAVIGAGAVQLSVFVNSNFASTLGDKPISWLAYSFRLMQFPIGLFGVAVMTATLPALARHAAQKDHNALGATMTEAMELVLCLTVPATVGLALLSEPILRMVYEHGRFLKSDTLATAQALVAYSLGLPGYAALKVVQPAFVAQGDAKTPMLVSIVGVLGSVALNFFFLRVLLLGHVGLALSTALLATFSTVTLLLIQERRRRTLKIPELAGQAARIIFAALLMAATIVLLNMAVGHLIVGRKALGAAAHLAIVMPVALGVYLAAAQMSGVTAATTLVQLIRKRRQRLN